MSTSEQPPVNPSAPGGHPARRVPGYEGVAPGVLSPSSWRAWPTRCSTRCLIASSNPPLLRRARPCRLLRPSLGIPMRQFPANCACVSGAIGNPGRRTVRALLPARPEASRRMCALPASAPSAPSAPRAGTGAGSALPRSRRFTFLTDARPLLNEACGASSSIYSFARFWKCLAWRGGIRGNSFVAAHGPSAVGIRRHSTASAVAVPGALGWVDSSAIPTFSFLEEARPLFSTPPKAPGPVPAAAVPEKPSSAGKAAPVDANPFASPLDLQAPQVPGTVAHPPDIHGPASYDALSEPRTLYPVDVVPTVAPGAGQPELIGDLGLSLVFI